MNKNNESFNPPGNLGAIFQKKSRQTGEIYYVIKATVEESGNNTFVAFKNKNYNEEDLNNKLPAFYLFPYKPKENKDENFNK